MKNKSFQRIIENVKAGNATRVMRTARAANALAKLASARNRQLLYGVKTRAIDHMVARMGLMTEVGDLSMDGDVIVGVLFVNGALHVKFNHLSAASQAIVVEKLSIATELTAVSHGMPKPEVSQSFFDLTPDSVKPKSQHHFTGAIHD